MTIPFARPDTFAVVFKHTAKGVAGAPDTVSIPKGQTIGYFTTVGETLGVDSMSVDTVATKQGYVVQGSPLVLIVDSIHVKPYSYPTTLFTISQNQYMNVIAVDAANGQARPLVAPLRVTLRPVSNKAFQLDSSAITIPVGQYFSGPDSMRVVTVSEDSDRVISTAPGSAPDSSTMIHVKPTPLAIQFAYPYNGYVGRGLKLQGNYVSIPAAAPNTLTVTLQRYDPVKDSISVASVLIPKGSSTSQAFEIAGFDSTGTDSITASAPGFVTARQTVTPYPVSLSASRLGASHLTTEQPQRAYVYTFMRQGYQQNASAPLTLTLQSSDSSVIQIDSANAGFTIGTGTITVPANQSLAYYKVRYLGSGGQPARIRVSAPGFAGDSTDLVTVSGPSLHFSYATATVGNGQIFPYEYVSVDNAVTGAPLVVHLARTDSLATPSNQVFVLAADSVVIPTGLSSSPPVLITGNVLGSAQLIGRATGYGQATAVVQVGPPELLASYKTLNLYVGGPPTAVPVYVADQTGTARAVATQILVGDTSSAPMVAIGDSAVKTIVAGGSVTVFNLTGLTKGTAAIAYASPGYLPDTTRVTVDTAPLALSSDFSVGLGKTVQTYVSIPFAAPTDITVSLSVSGLDLGIQVPQTVTILKGTSYVYFNVTAGLLGGVGVLNASAPGFRDATSVNIQVL